MTAKRTTFLIWTMLSMLAALVFCAGTALGQSLFSGASGSGPMFGAGQAPFLGAPGAAMMDDRPAPIVQARALALSDQDGLSARRTDRQNMFSPWSGYRPPSARKIRSQVMALKNGPPRNFSNENQLMCIAVSIYHEARNQPRDGQAAVASVILNRAANPDRWGTTPCEVVAPVQFSYLRADRGFAPIRNQRSWNEAVDIAADVMLRGPDPALHGADHYHATYVDPPWNRAMDWVVRIDDHIFWKSRPKAS